MLKEALEQSGVVRLIGWTDANDDQDNIFRRALEAALYPFRLLVTPTAIKAYLTTVLFLVTSFTLLSISTTAFGLFYYNYIPQTDLERPIYLQYGADTFPRAEVPLNTNALISQQPYDVSIVLRMPRDSVNLAAGNFMLDLTLRGRMDNIAASVLETLNMEDQKPNTALHRSRRPAIMPYASPTTDLVSKLIHLPLHLMSFHDSDSATLTIPMFEEVEFARGKDNVPVAAEIEVQSQRSPSSRSADLSQAAQLRIYSAKLVFQVRFHGLRYLIYNHRVLAFAVFTTLFYTVSISTLAVVWAVIAFLLSTPKEQSLVKQEPRVKQEGDTSDPLRTASDYKSDKTQKRIADDSENETINLRENWSTPHVQQSQFTPQTSEPASAASHEQAVSTDGAPDEHADDEDEESEDELQQYERMRKRMEYEARQRQLAHDSGIGTSLESENAGRSALVRRSNSRKGSERDQ